MASKSVQRAYITVLSDNSYINGLVVLDASLKAVKSKYPLVCIVTPEVTQENLDVLNALKINYFIKDVIKPECHGDAPDEVESLDTYGWHKALVKFNIFNMTAYDKLVYLDCDIIVRQNLDYLFDKPHMSATVDVQRFEVRVPEDRTFCSCLLVVKPNHQEFLDIMDFFYHFDAGDKLVHDQWVLQEYFKDWNQFPELILDEYTCPWTTYFGGDNVDKYYYSLGLIKALHIIDKKPWNASKQYFIDLINGYPIRYPYYGRLCLDYIDTLNYTITELAQQGITSSNLKIIQ